MDDVAWKSAKQYREIKYETADGIAKITINRPERRNAFTPLTVTEMYDAFSVARDDASIGVIILTGANHGGRHEDEAFCSGGDQKIRGNGGYVGEDNIPRLNVLDLQHLIRVVPKPVIAMVNGYAIGGGHVLHLLCDLSIAAETAKFGQTGPKVGSFDAGYGAGYLANVVGCRSARDGASQQGRSLRGARGRMRVVGARDAAVLADGAALHEGELQRGNRWACGHPATRRRRHAFVLHYRRGEGGSRRVQGEASARLHSVP